MLLRVALVTAVVVCAHAEPLRVGSFEAESRTIHADGVDVRGVAASGGTVWIATASGVRALRGGTWAEVAQAPATAIAASGKQVWWATPDALWSQREGGAPERIASLPEEARALIAAPSVMVATGKGVYELKASKLVRVFGGDARQVAASADGRLAVGAADGLYLRCAGADWERQFPRTATASWAPVDVRGVAFDKSGRLWFASPQGVGCLEGDGKWQLFTGADGLPYDDFTTIAAEEDGAVWFGTRIGAIRFDGKRWEYRQGRRWLPGDEVRGISGSGNSMWVATSKGVSAIERKPMTLREKAQWFESEIDRRHRRTPYEYVHPVVLATPGDTSKWVQVDSDNDGLWTSMYGAGECFAFGATKDETARVRAKKAFEALRFLGEVTQGGSNPAPRGFVARTVLPTSGPDPNARQYTPERDREKQKDDALWKVIVPRWPKSADGQWYWKSDTSSDELDGHYFFYGVYYDLVAQDEAEKQRVRDHVRAMTDHLVDHGFQFVDHDGKVTRWGAFDPTNLNNNRNWWQERGLNSLSMLAYLKVAEHITGDGKYARASRELIDKHGYAMNAMISKTHLGPGAGNQSDDEMLFMNFYSLLRYEKDPDLRQKYLRGFHHHFQNEQPEMNPVFNFLYAAVAKDATFHDAFGPADLSPTGDWIEDSVDTLKRLPLDRIDWGLKNSHRKDIVRLPEHMRERKGGYGQRVNGKVLPADERYVGHWNHDPWALDYNGSGRTLGDGAVFLLPYYMGLYHGFIAD